MTPVRRLSCSDACHSLEMDWDQEGNVILPVRRKTYEALISYRTQLAEVTEVTHVLALTVQESGREYHAGEYHGAFVPLAGGRSTI